jgi:hypothetical protein
MTWLGLYQSASIWLVFGLSPWFTQSSIVPQVQVSGRPIASRIAAAAATARKARARVRARVIGPRLGRGGAACQAAGFA